MRLRDGDDGDDDGEFDDDDDDDDDDEDDDDVVVPARPFWCSNVGMDASALHGFVRGFVRKFVDGFEHQRCCLSFASRGFAVVMGC